MITNLELTGWRAYDHVAVDFKPGTTFVIARNGIGKTSLLQGAAYALFGDRSGYGTQASIRKGFARAVAEVTVALTTDSTLRIQRTITAKKPAIEAYLDGTRIAEDRVDGLITEAFGADVADLARLTFLPAGSLQDYEKEKFHLHRHLCRLFGVEQLQAVLPDIAQMRAEARTEISKVKEVKRASDAELASWQTELEVTDVELERARAAAAELRKQHGEAVSLLQLAEDSARHGQLLVEREEFMEALRSDVSEVTGQPVNPQLDLSTVISDLDQDASEQTVAAERARGRLEGRIEMIDASRHQLDDADADCPVCRRPLDPDTREQARRQHQADLARHRAEVAELEARADELNTRRRSVAALRRTLSQLPALPPTPVPVEPEDLAAARRAQTELQPRIDEIDEEIGMLRATTSRLRSQLATETENKRHHETAVAAYRREALVNAAEIAVTDMTKRIIAEKIDPLAAMVTSRWKTVFRGTRPALQLDETGELKLVREGSEIEFEDMSAGERAVALLVTRLLVLSVTAPSAFLWLDEPLEQLDPINRRLIAQLLARSTNGPVRQVVVTTFEEETARRLEALVDGVHVEQVTSAD